MSKLSSYARINRTKRALWEFDNILRSLYLLYYIDSLTLRRAVSFANFGALRFRTEGDQQIWGKCSRLLTNCIIYYNAVMLSRLLETKLSNADETQAQRLARVSPIAWRHVNFQGRYNFRQTSQAPDINELVEKLSLYPISLNDPLD